VEDRDQFDTLINEPLPGRVQAVSPEVVRAELDAFAALSGALGG
jgi:hypothetical protein